MSAAFIVDGQMEKKIIQRLCPNAPVRTTNLNGNSVSINAIAKTASSLARLFKDRYFPIVVIVDREGREETAEQIESALEIKMREMGLDQSRLVIGVADRMIENWILGSTRVIPEAVQQHIHSGPFEGRSGKSVLIEAYRRTEQKYHETTTGVELFLKINPEACTSPSFQRLRQKLTSTCSWCRS